MAAVCPGGSMVLATVVIVVKHRPRLLDGRTVDCRRIGTISIVITGISAIIVVVVWQYGASVIWIAGV